MDCEEDMRFDKVLFEDTGIMEWCCWTCWNGVATTDLRDTFLTAIKEDE